MLVKGPCPSQGLVNSDSRKEILVRGFWKSRRKLWSCLIITPASGSISDCAGTSLAVCPLFLWSFGWVCQCCEVGRGGEVKRL